MSANRRRPARREGVIVPMVTPVTSRFELDEPAVRRVVDYFLAGGIGGIFVVGTTGESASLSPDMRSRLVAVTVEQAAGRADVYAGVSGNCLAESVRAGNEYLQAGANALVAHLPFYYPLSDEEQLDYFTALLDAVDGPLVIYNIPITTHMTIPLDVVVKLADHPNAAGIKDSGRDVDRLKDLIKLLGDRQDYPVFVGYTAMAAEALKLGADGYVPSTGNIAPALCSDLYAAAREGRQADLDRCQSLVNAVGRVYQGGRTLGQSLAALKALMSAAGLCGPDVLPPLRTMDEPARRQIVETMEAEGLSLAELVK